MARQTKKTTTKKAAGASMAGSDPHFSIRRCSALNSGSFSRMRGYVPGRISKRESVLVNTICAVRLPAPPPPRLWQIVHHGWDDFLAHYEKFHRKTLGPLRPATVATVQSFLRCGDLASGFTRLQCPDCGHERLLASLTVAAGDDTL